MPTYVYRREDGTTFEIKQRITDDPLETCPETGQDVKRIITGNAGLIFKGDGFYVNDYGGSNGASEQSNSASSDTASSDTASSDADASSPKNSSEDAADATSNTGSDASSS